MMNWNLDELIKSKKSLSRSGRRRGGGQQGGNRGGTRGNGSGGVESYFRSNGDGGGPMRRSKSMARRFNVLIKFRTQWVMRRLYGLKIRIKDKDNN